MSWLCHHFEVHHKPRQAVAAGSETCYVPTATEHMPYVAGSLAAISQRGPSQLERAESRRIVGSVPSAY